MKERKLLKDKIQLKKVNPVFLKTKILENGLNEQKWMDIFLFLYFKNNLEVETKASVLCSLK